MNEILKILMDFWKRQLSRFVERDEDGWDGWDEITEKECQNRAVKNARKGDYIDAANLCILADYARIKRIEKMDGKHERLSHI